MGKLGFIDNFRLPVLLCCLSVIILTAPCSGQEIGVESVIPAYSAAYIEFENASGIWNSVNEMPALQAAFMFGEMADTKAALDDITKSLDIDMQALLDVFGGKIALVQVYVDIIDSPPPAIIARVDNAEDAAGMIAKIERSLNEESKLQFHSESYRSIQFSLIEQNEGDFAIRYILLDELFIFALSEDTFEAILDVYLEETPPLIFDPKFNNTRAKVALDGEVLAYMNMEIIWPVARQVWGSDMVMLLRILGFNEVKSLAWTTNMLKPIGSQEMYMYTGEIGDSRPLISLLTESKPLLSPHLLPVASSDAFFAMNIGDPETAWDIFMSSLMPAIGAEEYDEMQDDIIGFEQKAGVRIKGDLLSSLDGEMGFAVPVSAFMNLVDGFEQMQEFGLMIFCRVEDRDKCAMSLERIFSALESVVRQVDHSGVTIYQISDTFAGYIFADDLLILGRIQYLEDIISEEPPLVVSEKFARINSQLSDRPGLMCYVDIDRIGEMMLMAGLNPPPEDGIMDIKTPGSIGGTVIFDGEGLVYKFAVAPDRSWLKLLDDMAGLFMRQPR